MASAKKCISPREFAKWQVYYNVEPFGEQREDLRTAVLICYLINHLSERKEALQPKDILPFIGQGEESVRASGRQRGIELEKQMRVFTQLHNWSVEANAAKGAVPGAPGEYRPAPGGRLS